eukprot:g4295.t1
MISFLIALHVAATDADADADAGADDHDRSEECDVLEGVALVGKVARSTSRTPWWASLSNTHTRSPNRIGMERVSSMGSRFKYFLQIQIFKT